MSKHKPIHSQYNSSIYSRYETKRETDVAKLNRLKKTTAKKIDDGKVIELLKKHPEGLGAVEIASKLTLHTQLVRNHLNELVKAKQVRLSNKPYQNRLDSEGLVYIWQQKKPC